MMKKEILDRVYEIILKLNNNINYAYFYLEELYKNYKAEKNRYKLEEKKYKDDTYALYNEIKESINKNINLYIYKPDVIINKENETLIPKIDIYKLLDDIEDLSLNEKKILVDETLILKYLDMNNCIYAIYNNKKKEQPVTFTLWLLNPSEIRISVFIQNGEKKVEISKVLEELLNIYDTKMFRNITTNKKEREANNLIELIINLEDWRQYNKQKHLVELSGLVIILILIQFLRVYEKNK